MFELVVVDVVVCVSVFVLVGVYGDEMVLIELLLMLVCDFVVGVLLFVCWLFVVFGNVLVMCVGECYFDDDLNCLFSGCYV